MGISTGTQIKGKTIEAVSTVVNDTAAYTALDAFGALSSVAVFSDVSGRLKSITLVDKEAKTNGLTIFLFSASPASAGANNAAFAVNDADMIAYCIGQIKVVSGDWKATPLNSVANLDVDKKLKSSDGNLYYQIMMESTPTYVGSSQVQIRFDVEPD